MLEKVYFHEDDYLQIELLPKENFSYLKSENDKINGFAKQHAVGAGFDQMFQRGAAQVPTEQLQIKLEDFDEVTSQFGFEKAEIVCTGYGAYEEPCTNTNAYQRCDSLIFCDYEQGIIHNIWLEGFYNTSNSHCNQLQFEILFQIGQKWGFILNDWNASVLVVLEDELDIEAYMRLE